MFIMFCHFLFLAVYTLGGLPEKKIQFFSLGYIYPFFHQSWRLFVPPPDTNYHLYAEYGQDGSHHSDIFQEILINHQANRLKGYGPVVIALVNTIHYFEKNTGLQNDYNQVPEEDLYFKMLLHSTLNYLKYTRRVEMVHLRLKLVVEETHTKKARVYYN